MRDGSVGSGWSGRRFGHGRHRTFWIEQMVVARPEPEFDQSAGIGNGFVLPTVVVLELAQRVFGGRVPFSAWFARQVVLLDECFLDLLGAPGINLLLAALGRLL